MQQTGHGEVVEAVRPGIRPGQAPAFYEMDEYAFQDLCRDLLDAEPGVATCDIYGTRGQSQDGIDLIAHRAAGDGLEVGQCKCYSTFSPRQIRKASDEFLAHWERRWSKESIQRFVLFVACGLDRAQQQDAILEERRRFEALGVRYEVWSAAKIRNKLRSQPGIVATYLKPPEYWVREICGEAPPVVASTQARSQTSVVISAVIGRQLEESAAWVSGEIEQRLEAMRSAWREGRHTEPLRWVKSLRQSGAAWPLLPDTLKARLLCFQAALELDISGDVERARQLLEEAHELASTENETRVRALIALREDGPSGALEVLAGQDDVDSLNLRAALLLQMGDLDGCRSVLEQASAEPKPNPETLRLKALLHLVDKHVEEAQLEAQKALELAPDWEGVRLAAATVDFFSALSPAALPGQIVAWPDPVDWSLAKRDDQALSRLRRASEAFRGLAEGGERSSEERRHLQGWLLASLANDPERQEEAISYCRQLLQADPAHYPALAWAVARNFGIDLKPSEKAVNKLVATPRPDVHYVIARVICYLIARKAKKAIALLEQTRAAFEGQGARALWDLWRTQALVAVGRPQDALTAIEASSIAPELEHVRILALRALRRKTAGKRTGRGDELVERLKADYDRTGDALFLLELCRLMARRGEWGELADRAREIVEALGTADAVALAALGAYNAGRHELCLSLLDDHRDFFGRGKLPSELRRMRALCQQALGLLPAAIREAEELAREAPTVENALVLADLYVRTGDLKALALVARHLASREDLSASQALTLARLVAVEDPGLAAALWRRALELGTPDEGVGTAVSLGYQFGLDRELGPLQARMSELGRTSKGGIQIFTIEELASRGRKWQESAAKLDEGYRKGLLPVHLLAGWHGVPLAVPYHSLLADNAQRPDPLRQPALLVRHGGRALASGFPNSTPSWRLNLDLTAFLLAAHLEILDAIERAFAPLRVPQDVVIALLGMIERLQDHQPSRLPASRQIVDLMTAGSLNVVEGRLPVGETGGKLAEELGEGWVALFNLARRSSGYLLDYLPLRTLLSDKTPEALPEGSSRHLVNCRALAEALRRHGPLSEEAYGAALRELGSEGLAQPSETLPEPGSPLILHGNLAEELARAGLLRPACERLRVSIDRDEYDRARARLLAHEQSQPLVAWLRALVDRLNRGLVNGTYQMIPTAPSGTRDTKADSKEGPELSCLVALLRFPAEPSDVIWSDDRYVNSYLRRDAVAIVGISEVLKALVAARQIDEPTYYRKVALLREANARLIPIEAGEILHHLGQARVEGGAVVETSELGLLRRYVAACLLRDDLLQRPPLQAGAANEHGELAVAVGLGRAIADSLVGVWEDPDTDEATCRARADWLLANLYLDHAGLLGVSSLKRPDHDDRYLVAIGLAGLLSQAISLQGRPEAEDSPRQRYLAWVYDRILAPRFDAEPHLAATVAEQLGRIIAEVAKSAPQARPALAIEYLRAFYRQLPTVIREGLERDIVFATALGIQLLTIVSVEDLKFEPTTFWRAATEALNGRPGSVTPVEMTAPVVFQPLEDPRGADGFWFTHPKSGRKVTVGNRALGLLLESAQAREEALRRNRYWFDCPDEAFERLVADTVSIADPQQRVARAEQWLAESATVYYDALSHKPRPDVPLLTVDLLPPSVEGMLRYLRLAQNTPSGPGFASATDDAARSLIREEALAEAIRRLAGVPVPLPPAVVEALGNLSATEALGLVKKLLERVHSPLSLLHLVRILLRLDSQVRGARRLARRVLKGLLGADGVVEVEAFLALVRWVDAEFDRWRDMEVLPGHLRLALAWMHADRLYATLVGAGISSLWLRDSFGGRRRPLASRLFEPAVEHRLDIAHPLHVNLEILLLAGTAYALNEAAEKVLDERLRELLSGEAFVVMEGRPLPNPALLRDPSRGSDGLGSLFGVDRGQLLALLLGIKAAQGFSKPHTEPMLDEAVGKLADPDRGELAWTELMAVLGEYPADEGLAGRLRAAMLGTDFGALCRKNTLGAVLAMRTATAQAINLADEDLKRHLRVELVKLAQLLGSQLGGTVRPPSAGDESTDELGLLLLESVVRISVASGRGSPQVVEEFAELVQALADAWPAMARVYQESAQWLSLQLPLPQAQHLWRLVVRLRTR